jgi:hypothetical protein
MLVLLPLHQALLILLTPSDADEESCVLFAVCVEYEVATWVPLYYSDLNLWAFEVPVFAVTDSAVYLLYDLYSCNPSSLAVGAGVIDFDHDFVALRYSLSKLLGRELGALELYSQL